MFARREALTCLTSKKCLLSIEQSIVWEKPGFEVDSFEHEVRALDRHLSAPSKVDQFVSVLVCTPMQAASLNVCWVATLLFLAQLLRSHPLSTTSRRCSGKQNTLAPAVRKIDLWPPPLCHLLLHVC
jgi:hypothetical protein